MFKINLWNEDLKVKKKQDKESKKKLKNEIRSRSLWPLSYTIYIYIYVTVKTSSHLQLIQEVVLQHAVVHYKNLAADLC